MNNTEFTIPESVNTLIWDLDGTILDSLGMSIETWQAVLAQNGFPVPSENEIAHNYHGSLYDTAKGLAPTATEAQIQQLLDDFLRIDNASMKDADDHVFEDAVDLAKRAHEKGLRQILVTNRAHGIDRGNASPRTFIDSSLLRDYIKDIICGDEVADRKPSKDVLGDMLGSDAEPLVIGDQFVDAQFAVNLGCLAVLVNRRSEAMSHTAIIETMDQRLIRIVDSLHQVRL